MHASITAKRVMAAVKRDDYTGFCLACGKTRKGCEPDARNYPCPHCKEEKVYGAEELLLMVM